MNWQYTLLDSTSNAVKVGQKCVVDESNSKWESFAFFFVLSNIYTAVLVHNFGILKAIKCKCPGSLIIYEFKLMQNRLVKWFNVNISKVIINGLCLTLVKGRPQPSIIYETPRATISFCIQPNNGT